MTNLFSYMALRPTEPCRSAFST